MVQGKGRVTQEAPGNKHFKHTKPFSDLYCDTFRRTPIVCDVSNSFKSQNRGLIDNRFLKID